MRVWRATELALTAESAMVGIEELQLASTAELEHAPAAELEHVRNALAGLFYQIDSRYRRGYYHKTVSAEIQLSRTRLLD